MSLDVTAFRKVQLVAKDARKDQLHVLVNPHFPGRADDLQDGGAYDYAGRLRGWSAPYSTYGEWRNELAKLAGYPERLRVDHRGPRLLFSAGAWEATAGPFWELINFADNEGCIGTAVSAKLAADFATFQPKADAHPDRWFREKYEQWRAVFEFAADGGAVEFH